MSLASFTTGANSTASKGVPEMWVSLDKERMRVLHKHPRMKVVCDLVRKDIPSSAAVIGHADLILKGRTEFDLRLIFRHLTNNLKDLPRDEHLYETVLQLVEDMPETDEALVLTLPLYGQQAPAQRHASTPAAATVPARIASAPRSGVRALVFEVADKIWNAAGSPTAVAAVLVLRKQMMNELFDNHSIKKTTASTTLGEWQKIRLNLQ